MASSFPSSVQSDLTFHHLQSQYNASNNNGTLLNDGTQFKQNFSDDTSSWSDVSSSYVGTPYEETTFNLNPIPQQQNFQGQLNKIPSSTHTVPSSKKSHGRGAIQSRASSRSLQRAANANPYAPSVPNSPTGSTSNSNTESISGRSNSVSSEQPAHSNCLSTTAFVTKARQGAPTLQDLTRYAAMIKECKTSIERGAAKRILASSWLLKTYGNHAESTVPRQALYASYHAMCDKLNVTPVRAASLGKIVIALFQDIRTRRLGTRGASKYYYTGIAPTSLNELLAIRKYAVDFLGQIPAELDMTSLWGEEDETGGIQKLQLDHALNLTFDRSDNSGNRQHNSNKPLSNESSILAPVQHTFSDILDLPPVLSRGNEQKESKSNRAKISRMNASKSKAVMASPRRLFAEIDTFSPPVPLVSAAPKGRYKKANRSPTSSPDSLFADTPLRPSLADPSGNICQHVWSKYSEHTHTLIESIRAFRVDRFEIEIRTYFSSMSIPQLATLRTHAVLPFLCLTADAKAYDKILSFLVSSTSTVPSLSAHHISSIKQLAINLENIYILSLGEPGEKFSKSFAEAKLEMAARFSHLLLRVLDLTDVSQALCVIFRSKSQCRDMLATYSGIQWESIKKHLYLIAPNDRTGMVGMLEFGLLNALENIAESDNDSTSLELLAAFVKSVAIQFSSFTKHPGDDSSYLNNDSRTCLVQFSWLLSQILRDLTLSSASTFGLFQVLKLWLEDMLAIAILRQTCVSHSRENLSIAVRGNNSSFNELGDSVALMTLDTGLSPTFEATKSQNLSKNMEVPQPSLDLYGSGSANFASQMPAPMMSSHALCAFDNYSSASYSDRSSISVLDSSYMSFRNQECNTPGSSDLECGDLSGSALVLDNNSSGSEDHPQFILAPPVGHFDTYPYQSDGRTPMPWSDSSGLRTAIPEPRRNEIFAPGPSMSQAKDEDNLYNIEEHAGVMKAFGDSTFNFNISSPEHRLVMKS